MAREFALVPTRSFGGDKDRVYILASSLGNEPPLFATWTEWRAIYYALRSGDYTPHVYRGLQMWRSRKRKTDWRFVQVIPGPPPSIKLVDCLAGDLGITI